VKHEETWTAELHGNACECSSRVTIDGRDGDDAVAFYVNDGGRARSMHPRLVLAAAAPEMARLLLSLAEQKIVPDGEEPDHPDARGCCFFCPMEDGHHQNYCRLAIVLRKAGVLEQHTAAALPKK
jgi:hypothetical protein